MTQTEALPQLKRTRPKPRSSYDKHERKEGILAMVVKITRVDRIGDLHIDRQKLKKL